MKKNMVSKGLVLGVILLFVGSSILTNVSAKVFSNENAEELDVNKISSPTIHTSNDIADTGYKPLDRSPIHNSKEDNGCPNSKRDLDCNKEKFDYITDFEGFFYENRGGIDNSNRSIKNEIITKFNTGSYRHSRSSICEECSQVQPCNKRSTISNDPIIRGYVNDSQTYLPIENASLDLYWTDNQGSNYILETSTNESGFYNFNVPAGDGTIVCYANGYYTEISMVYLNENDILWNNFSLEPGPPQNSIVCGFITDYLTGAIIEDVAVKLLWEDDQGDYLIYNSTYSDSLGFYIMNVAVGEIRLYVYTDGYFNYYTDGFNIDENETLWVNISLYPHPPEYSVVCGYVTDDLTDDPVEDADVNLNWRDDQGHYYYNNTYSNSSGFYLMNVAAGEIDLYVYADGYFYNSMDYFDIGDNETLWINISLYPHPVENSIVCGYITDASTGEPIGNADISLTWRDDEGRYLNNFTYSCECCGFYLIHVAMGEIELSVSADGYFNHYTGYFDIGENETLWVNMAMIPFPPENSVVQGYITDTLTGHTIENAYVNLHWHDDQGHCKHNDTYSNSSGFYLMNVAAGEIELSVYADGYLNCYTDWFDIGDNETLWINISLYPYPVENSVVCGYVTDDLTDDPVEDADVNLNWRDDQGHSYHNYTHSNSSGFYLMNVAAGEIELSVYADGYFNYYTDWFDIGDNETLWINISLYPHPPEYSVVCGYVTDDLTGGPVEDADVNLHWRDDQGHSYQYYTHSNSSGFYLMNVAAGEIELYVYADGYFYYYTDWFDIGENETLWINVSLSLINYPPSTPDISGPLNGKAGKKYEYTFNATDPDGDNVKYFIDWGDNETEEIDYIESGKEVKLNHTWIEKGTYKITAKAEDIFGAESNWGELEVNMPMNQQTNSWWFLQFLQNHPRMFPILRLLLDLY